jgi:hypothetical protein
MGLRDAVRRLQKRAEGPLVVIPLEGGGVARFPESQLADAYLIANAREGGQTTEDHPLCRACRHSSDPRWRNSVWAGPEDEEIAEFEEIEDLSE